MNESFPILIAESDARYAEHLKNALREVGFNNPFHVSADGQDVIHYLQGHGIYEDRQKYRFPRMITIALDLPRLDGLGLLAWLQEHEHCNVIPRLVLSHHAESKNINRAYQLGVNTYLVKPATYDGLVRMMHLVFQYWDMAQKPELPAKC